MDIKSFAGISCEIWVVLSLTVAFPVSSTSTILSGFAPSTAILTSLISSTVKLLKSVTGVFLGTTGVKSLLTTLTSVDTSSVVPSG